MGVKCFNFRETTLDLYVFYREVTARGGFHQVSKDGKWNEVASALNIKSHVSVLPSQIQNVYDNLLYQYEQMHYYRTPKMVSAKPGLPLDSGDAVEMECSPGKQKSWDKTFEDDQVEKRKCAADYCQTSTGPGTPEQKSNIVPLLDDKEMIKDPYAPLKPRTAYQIFVKMECDRLRKILGESSGTLNFRNRAIEAWKHLSQSDRLPYIKASRRDKERFNREMVVYKQQRNKSAKGPNSFSSSTPSIISFGPSSPIDNDYYVTLETEAGSFFVPDESLVESTIQMLKNTQSNDPMFQINWDGCCASPDSFN